MASCLPVANFFTILSSFLMLVTGGLIIYMGTYIITSLKNKLIDQTQYVTVAVGALVIPIAILGIWSAIKESRKMISLFCVSTLVTISWALYLAYVIFGLCNQMNMFLTDRGANDYMVQDLFYCCGPDNTCREQVNETNPIMDCGTKLNLISTYTGYERLGVVILPILEVLSILFGALCLWSKVGSSQDGWSSKTMEL